MALNILNDRDVMINRELGLIQFYRRVLAQVLDENIPALERLRYLCIVTKIVMNYLKSELRAC